jgi:hypothetical protein
MSEQIDWSKAPEGAMVLLKHVRYGAYAVSESYGDEAKTWHWPDPRYSFPLMPSMWRIVAGRPATQSWSGDGLPPAGVVCEYRVCDGPWYKCEIRYTVKRPDGGVIAYCQHLDLELALCEPYCCFRPIRTTEQIAADWPRNWVRK